jgi:hypothetical protein
VPVGLRASRVYLRQQRESAQGIRLEVRHYGKRAEQVARYLTGEVETYAQYLEGRVYGFITEIFNPTTDKWEEGDSCWGFYGQDYEGIAEISGFSVEEVKDAFNNVEY